MNLRFFLIILLFISVNVSNAQAPGVFEEPENMTVHRFSKRIKKAKDPVLVCFGTDTSIASIQQKNILYELSKQYQAGLDILSLDINRNPKLAAYFNLDSLPVLILYIDAYPVWLIFGKVEKEQLMKCLLIYGIKFKNPEPVPSRQASAVLKAK